MVPDYTAGGAVAVGVGNDTTAYTPPLAGFVVGVAGNVNIVDSYGNTVVIPAIAGYTYWVKCSKIKATSTTATGITGFYG